LGPIACQDKEKKQEYIIEIVHHCLFNGAKLGILEIIAVFEYSLGTVY
jgi:hypothetical protein